MKAKVFVAVAALVFTGWLAGTARADFILTGSQQLAVNTAHGQGTLFQQSKVWIVSGAFVHEINAFDNSSVYMSGGRVDDDLFAYHNSSIYISGGMVYDLFTYDTSTANISGTGKVNIFTARNSSTVNISGGTVNRINTYDNSTVAVSGGTVDSLTPLNSSAVDISGGTVNWICGWGSGVVSVSGGTVNNLSATAGAAVTFHAQDFLLGPGLSLDGERLLGTGILSGEWSDGTRWVVKITANAAGATILVVPEPATLSLLALGGLALLRRRRGR